MTVTVDNNGIVIITDSSRKTGNRGTGQITFVNFLYLCVFLYPDKSSLGQRRDLLFLNLSVDNHEFIPVLPFQADTTGFILFFSLPLFVTAFYNSEKLIPVVLNTFAYLASPAASSQPPGAAPSSPPVQVSLPTSDSDSLCWVTPSPHGHLLILLSLTLLWAAAAPSCLPHAPALMPDSPQPS